ncbi:MAG: DUF4388 domain-containing protein [Solirubrobacterales bacterium]
MAEDRRDEGGAGPGQAAGSAELREAVFELQEYLSDHSPPLLVADSIALLIQQPPQLLAAEIGNWVAHQRPSVPDLTVADLLFHGARKVTLMGELDLVPKADVAFCLAGVAEVLLSQCPEEDRELLRQNLDRLRHSSLAGTAADPTGYLEKQPGAVAAARAARAAEPTAPMLTRGAARGLRRLSLFLERLQPPVLVAGVPAVAGPVEQRSEVASQFMTAAAVQSSTAKDLDDQLAPLRQLGIDTAMDQVLKTLARTLPGWGSLPVSPGAAPPPPGLQLNAMRQIVSIAEAPEDAAKRFRELVHAAIEQFNEGNLGRAVTMFELANQLIAEEKVKAAFVDPLRKGGHEYLDPERLRRFGERLDVRSGLRTILNFFEKLRPEGLLQDLDREPRRERRHQLLAMLETHGEPARAKAWELLKASVDTPESDVDPYFQMNLVYLMRVIQRPADASVEDEVNVVMRTPGRDSPPPLVKQVIGYLAALRHDKSERALITYLRVFENMILQPETAVYSPEDIETLLDRTCIALARYATPRAWRALVDHGLKAEPRLGSPMARLVEAGRQDLSGSKDLVDRVIAALKAELPRTVLGFKVKKSDDRIVWLIQALSGTPLPEVRAALQEIVEKHPGETFAEAAAKAISTLGAGAKPAEAAAAGLSGDLELFGLPGVLQTLSQSQLTGVLSLMKVPGQVEASVLFEKGSFRGAQLGTLRGPEAVYELFEKPFPGTFAFVSRTDVATQGASTPPQDIIGLLLEGVRRHDEFKRAAAMVPDQTLLEPTGGPSTRLADEEDGFARLVWSTIANGANPVECEASVRTDGYRVRRLLAHWVEEGALKARSANPAPAR